MGLRKTILNTLLGKKESPLSAKLDAWAREKGFLTRADLPASPEVRLAELTAANEKLEKKLSMAMGAVQAATAQLQSTRAELAQVSQQAASALATAEAAADGVTGVESRLDALVERLGAASNPTPNAPEPVAPPKKPRAKR